MWISRKGRKGSSHLKSFRNESSSSGLCPESKNFSVAYVPLPTRKKSYACSRPVFASKAGFSCSPIASAYVDPPPPEPSSTIRPLPVR